MVDDGDRMNDAARAPVCKRIAADLRPVRPLRHPWVRAAVTLPVALLVLVGVPWSLGVRSDASGLGAGLTWGLSLAQVLVGLGLVALALQESVPGRALSPRLLAATIGTGIVVVLAVTAITFAASPRVAPDHLRMPFFSYCLRHSALLGVPVVLVAAYLAGRALPMRPVTVGSLFGLGGGLMTDAGWRLFCNVSAPSHVLPAHGGAVLSLMVLGACAAFAGEFVRRKSDDGPVGGTRKSGRG
jgi:hypothetical protein